jgi:hypothetical protein
LLLPLLVMAADSPPEFQQAPEALAQALPHARLLRVGGGHLIDPASPEVIAFIEEVLEQPVAAGAGGLTPGPALADPLVDAAPPACRTPMDPEQAPSRGGLSVLVLSDSLVGVGREACLSTRGGGVTVWAWMVRRGLGISGGRS